MLRRALPKVRADFQIFYILRLVIYVKGLKRIHDSSLSFPVKILVCQILKNQPQCTRRG